jgi:hypothetical protein
MASTSIDHKQQVFRLQKMFVSETTNVLSYLRMCLCTWRNDPILYAFERILFGANVAKSLLSDIACSSFDKR